MSSKVGLQRGDFVYYARAVDLDCLPLTVHNVNDKYEYFTAVERVKKHESGITYLFNYSDYGKVVFSDLYEAKDYLEDVKDMIEENERQDS